jgi:hypothetical protein
MVAGLLQSEDDDNEAWSCPYKIEFPISEIDSNRGLEHLGVYFVSQEMDFLAWCPLTLLQGSAARGVVQQYGHRHNWRMTVPHMHRESLEGHSSLIMDATMLPPFFRFLDLDL